MKFLATLTAFVLAFQAVYGFQPVSTSSVARTQLMAKTTDDVSPVDAISRKVFPSIAATTGVLLSLGIDPAFAAKELPPDTSYIGKDFTAAFLPAIMVPLVGLVFPAFSMALFFLYSQQDDIESA
mmetsp:Transcript_21981/g.46363  ORF Transcript_21981/g.46363 Transcript_21981/m.46363 type:complete len:125 (-) Transcript_21981:274-648(-)|eukprot:CAMPEP_0201123462 /NCGR_PEP_ID=MMETSP0850-20130426/7087_1 /ASSEMBLY_ACC=CAM_ASM_000622 /TAXON_ID=183588 /ORGANISM="Pseudo-nitzschia fraudulenta, Strain WWA7" /LENGTH=124 /DNA_ID=CAMNT_0047390379 /DNA_START=104 /DNA_END=478 /DNA_ORIENTATION=+